MLRKIQVGDEAWPDGSTVVHRISGMPAPANDRRRRRILSALALRCISRPTLSRPYPDHQHPSWRWGDAKRMAFCT